MLSVEAIEHKSLQDRISLFVGMLIKTNGLDEFIARNEHSEAIGCFVDPTLWMKGIDHLTLVTAYARAMNTARSTCIAALKEFLERKPQERDKLAKLGYDFKELGL